MGLNQQGLETRGISQGCAFLRFYQKILPSPH